MLLDTASTATSTQTSKNIPIIPIIAAILTTRLLILRRAKSIIKPVSVSKRKAKTKSKTPHCQPSTYILPSIGMSNSSPAMLATNVRFFCTMSDTFICNIVYVQRFVSNKTLNKLAGVWYSSYTEGAYSMPAKKSDSNTGNPLKDLLLMFAVPAIVAIIVALFVYVPRWAANPLYDFIYYTCSYSCSDRLVVGANGTLSQTPTRANDSYGDEAIIMYYEADTDATRVISLDEAISYRLDPSSKSPDGYSLEYASNGSYFLFWGTGWQLESGMKHKTVKLAGDSYGSGDVKFVGWVKK